MELMIEEDAWYLDITLCVFELMTLKSQMDESCFINHIIE